MISLFLWGTGLALVLNLIAVIMNFGYLHSVLLVFGGISLFLAGNAKKLFNRDDWKFSTGFILFSNFCTLIVEVLMMKFDVWGFTRFSHELIGVNILSAPIEEYIYWAFCPIICCYSYMLMVKDKFVKTLNPFKVLEYVKRLKIPKVGESKYVEAKDGKYNRGQKYPVYIWLQVLIVTAIVLMSRYFKGSWKALVLTTLLFFFTAWPNELYSVYQGFWAYNDNRLLGFYLFNIPFEGYLMYFISPVCASMMIDIARRTGCLGIMKKQS